MKYLSQFQVFDWENFSKGKSFKVVGVAPWRDYTTKGVIGTDVKVVITRDNTSYKLREGDTTTNLYERLSFKIRRTDLSVPTGANVQVVNPTCVIYGEYRNQLSVKADDIQILMPQKKD